MASNRVLKSELLSTITKSGKQITLRVATETQEWKRTKETARAQGPAFKDAVVKDSASLPKGTAELIQRESQHPSSSDTKDHWTAVARDKDHKYIETIHVAKPK